MPAIKAFCHRGTEKAEEAILLVCLFLCASVAKSGTHRGHGPLLLASAHSGSKQYPRLSMSVLKLAATRSAVSSS